MIGWPPSSSLIFMVHLIPLVCFSLHNRAKVYFPLIIKVILSWIFWNQNLLLRVKGNLMHFENNVVGDPVVLITYLLGFTLLWGTPFYFLVTRNISTADELTLHIYLHFSSALHLSSNRNCNTGEKEKDRAEGKYLTPCGWLDKTKSAIKVEL